MATKTQKIPRSPGRPAATGGIVVRDRLLDAAFLLIAEQGVAATSIAQIAARARVTPAMVHYYFRNRESLLDAIVAERIAFVVDKVWGPVEASDDPFVLVEGIVRRFADVVTGMPQLPALWLREIISDGGQLHSRVLNHRPTDKLALLSNAIVRGQQAGDINPRLDAGYMFLSIMGLFMMPLAVSSLFERVTHQRLNTGVLAEHVIALLRHGMDAPADKPLRREES